MLLHNNTEEASTRGTSNYKDMKDLRKSSKSKVIHGFYIHGFLYILKSHCVCSKTTVHNYIKPVTLDLIRQLAQRTRARNINTCSYQMM